MTTDANVIAFKRPEPPAPKLEFVELRLNTDTCGIEMTVVDEHGDTTVLTYRLVAKSSDDFDTRRLVEAWEGWKGSVGRAS